MTRVAGAPPPGHPVRGGTSGRWRRRTGIEPADDAARRPPVLKTGGATRHPDASGPDPTAQPRARPPAAAPRLPETGRTGARGKASFVQGVEHVGVLGVHNPA